MVSSQEKFTRVIFWGPRRASQPQTRTMRQPSTKAEFDNILAAAAAVDRAVVVDFTATWCGPCQAIAPVFEQLALEWTWVDFIKVDVDANQETAQHCAISAMPTFKVFRNGAEVGMARGASPDGLRQLVATHAGPKPTVRVDPAAQQAAQREALQALLGGPDKARVRIAVETLLKILRNVLSEPTEEKYVHMHAYMHVHVRAHVQKLTVAAHVVHGIMACAYACSTCTMSTPMYAYAHTHAEVFSSRQRIRMYIYGGIHPQQAGTDGRTGGRTDRCAHAHAHIHLQLPLAQGRERHNTHIHARAKAHTHMHECAQVPLAQGRE